MIFIGMFLLRGLCRIVAGGGVVRLVPVEGCRVQMERLAVFPLLYAPDHGRLDEIEEHFPGQDCLLAPVAFLS